MRPLILLRCRILRINSESYSHTTNTANSTDWAGTDDESTLGNYAWYYSNSDRKTHEVKKKNPNSLGLYDMSGNVREWCWDKNSSTITSTTPATGYEGNTYNHVNRGGSYSKNKIENKIAWRAINDRAYDRRYGFRVVRKAN